MNKSINLIWHTEKRKVKDLKLFPNNPRQATEKQYKDLEKSLDNFNIVDPLIINTDNVVIGGNFRLKILKAKGIQEVDVRVPNRLLTDKEANELNLRLNKNSGEWDFDILANWDENLLLDVGFSELDLNIDLNPKEKEVDNLETQNECPSCGYKW